MSALVCRTQWQFTIPLTVSLCSFAGMEKSLVDTKPNDPSAEPCENYENLPFHGLQNPPTKVRAICLRAVGPPTILPFTVTLLTLIAVVTLLVLAPCLGCRYLLSPSLVLIIVFVFFRRLPPPTPNLIHSLTSFLFFSLSAPLTPKSFALSSALDSFH